MTLTDGGAEPVKRLFPRLTGRAGELTPDRVARHQKARLEGAMVEAVARHGYAATTLRELVTFAGVSKSTFYDHFESKEDCFLATFDEIVDRLRARVEAAYQVSGDLRERLTGGLGAFMDLAVEEPAAAQLAAVESLSLGAAGVAHRERASLLFEAMLRKGFDKYPLEAAVSDVAVVAIMAGVRNTVYRGARHGSIEQLPGMVEPLVEWALCQGRAGNEVLRRAVAAAERPIDDLDALRPPIDDPALPGWDEPPDSRASRARLSQSQRMVRAAAAVVVEQGYEALSIPGITRAAGVSNQTFYEHFADKREPFLLAFEALIGQALGTAIASFERAEDHAEALGVGLRALFEEIAANDRFARLGFFELQNAGPDALDRADPLLEGLTVYLAPGAAPGEIGAPPATAVVELIPGSIWNVIQREIVQGRRRQLPQLAPEATRIALAPFGAP